MERVLDIDEFSVLVALESANESLTRQELMNSSKVQDSKIDDVLERLSEKGLISNGAITDAGLEALMPYRVKRAVLVAAGFGERLIPVTLETPKPLVRVNGKRIIDSLLDALISSEVEEIYIVRGYLGDQFDQLLDKYPNVKFIENDMYSEANNISSIFLAREKLCDAYVFESDILLSNKLLVSKYQYQSNYLAVPVERTDDWCFKMKDGYIDELLLGGTNCYQMCGISYWTEGDGMQLSEDIAKLWKMPGGKECFWDQAPLGHFKDNYKVSVRECGADDCVEIDTFKELQKIDSTYIER